MKTALDASRPLRMGNWERVAAAAVIFIGALGMIVLGGCFLVGALALVTNGFDKGPHGPLSGEEQVLLTVMYVLAGLCFLGALVLMLVALIGLCRLVWDRRARNEEPAPPPAT
jgi:hypothetical protein